MKFTALAAGLLLFAAGAHAADKSSGPLASEAQRTSYAIGIDVGQSLARQGVMPDVDAFLLGVKDGLGGIKPRITPEQYQSAMANLSKSVNDRFKETAKTNLDAGKGFLAENKKQGGVTELSSGLQYKELRKGSGAHPKAGDTIVAHYTGTLIDGTKFDSTKDRNEPATIPLDGVIKGWQEAIPLMTVGSRWQIFVPPNLAYGVKGQGVIGPNQTLIFEIELLEIKGKK